MGYHGNILDNQDNQDQGNPVINVPAPDNFIIESSALCKIQLQAILLTLRGLINIHTNCVENFNNEEQKRISADIIPVYTNHCNRAEAVIDNLNNYYVSYDDNINNVNFIDNYNREIMSGMLLYVELLNIAEHDMFAAE